MATFNDALEVAMRCVCFWEKKNRLSEVTMIRDVFGKISFLMNNTISMADNDKQELVAALEQTMGKYYSGRIYWKKLSHNQKSAQVREEIIIDLIEQERTEWQTVDGIVFYVSERAIAKKAWIYKRQNQESVWPYEEAVMNQGTKVVTFYSFKGGMGRTTALAAVALILAEEGKNVMMVDTDIEAPGLATLFFGGEMVTRGVLDYVIERGIEHMVRVEDYVLDVTDPSLLSEDAGQMYLFPAGKVDENYLQKLARIDYQDNREGYLREALEAMLINIKDYYNIDYILIDARAGFHDMGGIAVAQVPHGVVLFGNDSRQSWDGLTQVLRTLAEGHAEDFPVMLVGTMCPMSTAPDYMSYRERFINKAYTVCVENYYSADSGIPGIEAEDEIHFPELVPFHDQLLQGIELFSDGSSAKNHRVNAYKDLFLEKIESYRNIAKRMKAWFGEDLS